MTIRLPAMGDAQQAAWWSLMDLQVVHPTGWTLVGGQMVHLLCAERGAAPARATDDVDTVLDVRGEPQILRGFTTSLKQLGFAPAGNTWQGHQHRWIRDEAVIDLLIPRHLGERASLRTGAGGGTTIETPGAQQALDRSEDVEVDVAGHTGIVRRPNLLGALVAKAAAYTVTLDPARDRHIADFAVLATLLRPDDPMDTATSRDREHLGNILAATDAAPRTWSSVTGARDGLDRLRLSLELRPASQAPEPRQTSTPAWAQGHRPKGRPAGGEFTTRPRGEPDIDL
ncbi:hypothetical protein [Pengzhenrongella sp.]|uniref:hypothetical protein n=1 Tax=Pengzhenrongella sp. TaxID=2888820 RepID=UPI002F95A806